MALPEQIRIEVASPGKEIEFLPDVIRQLESLVQLLSDFAADEKDSRIEVIKVSKGSPLVFEGRAVRVTEKKRVVRGKSVRKQVARAVPATYRRLERVWESLHERKQRGSVDVEGLTALSECVRSLKGDVATITTGRREMVLDASLLGEIGRKLGRIARSHGTMTGELQGVNLHADPWNFTIYPAIGPKKVRCVFKEDLYPKVHAALGKVVRVEGTKEFSEHAEWPLRMQADDIEILEPSPEGSWNSLLDDLEAAWANASDDDRSALLEASRS